MIVIVIIVIILTMTIRWKSVGTPCKGISNVVVLAVDKDGILGDDNDYDGGDVDDYDDSGDDADNKIEVYCGGQGWQ